ncbi:SAVMC3_10250 family protein [Streptomyces sp. NPDC056257]|uniref:SAVMC3_10250 family protein n=1 Tax=Streptomyces sp. NPDC056257 TaxID=3345765 RepID=UPI0035DFAD96
MREIVYMSDGKLKQFLPEPRRVPRTGSLRVTTPVGGFDMDAPASDGDQSQLRHLEQVHKHMELVSRWYAEPGLRPGQWVQFEAPLRCVTLKGPHRNLLLFVDPPQGASECRLLMHGSVRHLRGWTPTAVDVPGSEAGDNESSLGPVFITRAAQVVRALSAQDEPSTASEVTSGPVGRLNSRGVRELLEALDAENGDIDTSAVMTGYARVSAVLPQSDGAPPCLVASPLTVQFADQQP